MTWEYEQADKFKSKFPRYNKKHPAEAEQCVVNLAMYKELLSQGHKPGGFHLGFMHTEKHGVIAVDQSGMDGQGKETRLYVYPEAETQTIHVLTIGDKNSQQDDVKDCADYVNERRKEQKNG